MRPFQSCLVVPALLAAGLFSAAASPPLAGMSASPEARSTAPAPDRSPPPAARARADAVTEHWYVLELDGRPAGWVLERWWREQGRWITEAETSLRLGRGRQELRIQQAGRFVETPGGDAVSQWTRRTLGSAPVESTYSFGPEGVRAVTLQGDRELRDVLPLPDGEWLTPAAARRAVRRHHRAGDASYRLRVVNPLEGPAPVTLTRTRVGPSELEGADGLWREEVSSAPGVVSLVDLDDDGQVLRSGTELLGIAATLRRADRESALATLESGPGPEVLLSTLVRPDRPLPHPDGLERAVYELSLARGDADGAPSLPELPSAGGQRAETTGGGARVTVAAGSSGRTAEPGRGGTTPEAHGGARRSDSLSPEARSRFLAPSPWLDHEDPEIRRLLERALARRDGGELRAPRERPPDADPLPALPARPPRDGDRERPEDGAPRPDEAAEANRATERARALERFVHRYVGRKDLGTGFATASEVARTAAGDCTEHSVLLAALLRADGVPTRLVAGLVYLEDFAGVREVFGYHMWVQARVAGDWLDLDATLPGGFGPTHIALATSELSGPEGLADLERVVPLVGRLRIRVLETSP